MRVMPFALPETAKDFVVSRSGVPDIPFLRFGIPETNR